MRRKLLSLMLAFAMLCAFAPTLTFAALGGDELTYTFDDGTLTISGTGDMEDFIGSYSYSNFYYSEDIKTIIIEDGVTNIGNYIFSNCVNLENVVISTSVTSIGKYALA